MQRYNILMIVCDQQRYDCVGAKKQYPVKTPNLDKLEKQGMTFDRAFTPIPLCCPARQSLLCGRRNESFGSYWNYDLSLPAGMLDVTEFAWPRSLRDAGYSNSYIGKWHVNSHHDPTEYGYKSYIGIEHYAEFERENYPQRSQDFCWTGGASDIPLEDSRTHWLANRAIEQLQQDVSENKLFHIRLDFTEPHLPCYPSEPFASMYNKQDVIKWDGFDETFVNKPFIQRQQVANWQAEGYSWQNEWSEMVASYYGIISQLDDAIGRVLQSLDSLGVAEDTIVIYTADHGDMCGSHHMIDKHYVMYDDIVRVPLIVRWPNMVDAGTRTESYVLNCLDLVPTILDMAGLEQDEKFDGRSLMPILRQQPPKDWRTDVVSSYNGQQFGLYNQRMLRNDDYKYIWNLTDIDELYDLKNDPGELVNLVGRSEYTELLNSMQNTLCDRLIEINDPIVTRSSWMETQLRQGLKLTQR